MFPVARRQAARCPAHPGDLVLLFLHLLEGENSVQKLQGEFHAGLLGVFLQDHQPFRVVGSAIGDAKGEPLAILGQDAVRVAFDEIGFGEVFRGPFQVELPGADVAVVVAAEAQLKRRQALVVAAQHGIDHALEVHRVGEAVADVGVGQKRLRGVQEHARRGHRQVVVEPVLHDMAGVEGLPSGLLVPALRAGEVEAVQLAFQKVLEGDVGIPNHAHADLVRIEAVAEVLEVVRPPVRDAMPLDGLALVHLADLVRPGVRFDLPVVVLHPGVVQHMEVLGLRAEGVLVVHFRPRLGIRALDADGVVVVALHVADALGVVVVVPGRDDGLRAVELHREDEVAGGHRHAVGPARLSVQPVVDAAPVGAEGPVRRQRRNGPARLRVVGDQAQLVVAQVGRDEAVGIGAHPAQRQWKAEHVGAEGAARLRLWRGEHGILVVGLPRQVRRQRLRQAVAFPHFDGGQIFGRGFGFCRLRRRRVRVRLSAAAGEQQRAENGESGQVVHVFLIRSR